MKIKNLKLKIIILFLFSLLFAIPSFAQTSTPSASSLPSTIYHLPSTVSPTSPVYTDLLVHNLFHTFSCLSVGSSVIGQPCLTYQLTQNARGVIQSVPVLSSVNLSGGALGATTSIIGALYMNPPIRTVNYLASVGEGLGIVKEANAQVVGSGAAVLDPILKLWQVSRNISYIIMIIIFVIIGLMIMFRQRINPQTVITAQAALPGLVIGLILITFSYFFAALLTDTAFIGTNLVGYYFSAAQPGSTPKLAQDIANANVGTIFNKYVGMISQGDIASVIQSLLDSLDGGVQNWIRTFAGIVAFQTGASVGGAIGSLGGTGFCAIPGVVATVATGGAAAVPGFIAAGLSPFCGMIGNLIVSLTGGSALAATAFINPAGTFGWALYFAAIAIMIYTMFKLLLKLINNYLSIIFLTISAPFQFLAASLPGRQGLVTNWILNMLCNILAFPAVFAVFYFVAYLWGSNTEPGRFFGISTQLKAAGNQTLPLFGGLDLSFIRILLAYGALLATPSIPDIICRTIGRVGQAGQLIGQEITGGTRGGQGYAGQLQGGIGKASGTLRQAETEYFGSPRLGEGLAGPFEVAGVKWAPKRRYGPP